MCMTTTITPQLWNILAKTHEKMFRLIRAKNPDLPIVLLSRPKWYLRKDEEERLEIIQSTYYHARNNGDNHVYLIDGRTLMQVAGNEGTVDNCHPNDLGFASMAIAVGNLLEEII